IADWRWLLKREDSPWYPAMRLFRQTWLGDWAGVFQRMADAIAKWRQAPGPPSLGSVAVPPRGLIGKIPILQIKAERVADRGKTRQIGEELATLQAARDRNLRRWEDLGTVAQELRAVNAALWQIEDDLRRCEQTGSFGPEFIELARSVYHQNDRRASLKQQINELLGAPFAEQKAYPSYGVS